MSFPEFKSRLGLVIVASSLALSGCPVFDSDSGSGNNNEFKPASGDYEATIRRTTSGVPHIKADTLGEAAFGAGYTQASDNVCTLAEAIVRARSERARFFGPGENDANVISDFSLKALGVIGGAEEGYENLSPESTAMIDGFTAGYNQYLEETEPSELPPQCRDQPWVREISPVDLLAHYRVVAQLASGGQFATGAVFLATPPDKSPEPVNVTASVANDERQKRIAQNIQRHARTAATGEEFVDTGLASNAWAIGGDMSEQGKGALLGNPHFPWTGPRRLYQMQLTVPGYLNVQGSGLLGTAVPLINFNENLGWSHTVSTSRRFTLYELNLGDDGDPMTYFKDGEKKQIQEKTFQIEVNTGAPEPATLERTFYYSEYGPMLSANAVTAEADTPLAKWGEDGATTKYENAAFTFRDANKDQNNLLDTWLGMSRASNLEEFKDVFRECGTTLWTNSIYADDQGNAYYIDSTSVPNLSKEALAVIDLKRNASPAYNALFNQGLTLLDGGTSRDDWVEGKCDGLVPFEDKPQLVRNDFVQNANDSFWVSNSKEPVTGISPLYGAEQTEQSARTRLSLKMLLNPQNDGFGGDQNQAKWPAGQDGKFGARDLIDTIYNNRSFWAEEFLPELRARCSSIGSNNVNVPGGDPREVKSGCDVLANWDGYYDTDSVGAHVFRVFMTNYGREICKGPDFGCLGEDPKTDLTAPFDPQQPVATPADPSDTNKGTADDLMLQSLARGLNALDAAGVEVDARFGDVQVYQPSGGVPPGGTPQELGQSFAWHGGHGEVDGAFNAIETRDMDTAQDTLYPIVNDPPLARAEGKDSLEKQGLPSQSGKWFVIRGTSYHFGLEFTEQGPEAYGLTAYSQSTDPGSEFFNDQAPRYSDKNPRSFPFSEEEIEQNLISNGEVTVSN